MRRTVPIHCFFLRFYAKSRIKMYYKFFQKRIRFIYRVNSQISENIR